MKFRMVRTQHWPISPERLKFALSLIERYQEHCAQDVYVAYYHARLLLRSGDKEKARAILTGDAIRLSTEFWFWTALADTFKGDDEEARRCCLSKAVLLLKPSDRKYTQKLRRELELVFENNPEYRKGSNNSALYAKHSEAADDIVGEAIKWLPAVVLSFNKERQLTVLFTQDGGLSEAKGEIDALMLKKLKRGAPVSVKVIGVAPDIMVLSVKMRRAIAWDILPWQDAVVTHKLAARQSVKLLLANGVQIPISSRMWHEAEAWTPGTILKVKLLRISCADQIVASKLMKRCPRFLKKISGEVKRIDEEGRAWIDNTIYVPRRLSANMGLNKGDQIKLIAVQSGKTDWEAITVDRT